MIGKAREVAEAREAPGFAEGVGVPPIVPGVRVPGVWTMPLAADGSPASRGGRLIDIFRPRPREGMPFGSDIVVVLVFQDVAEFATVLERGVVERNIASQRLKVNEGGLYLLS